MDETPEEKNTNWPLDVDDGKIHLSEREAQLLTDQQGYILDTEGGNSSQDIKVAKDGHTILLPQPSEDPNDPLNWSSFKKHLILFIISWAALLPDFGSAEGAVVLLQQAEIWHMSPNVVNHSQAGNVFMLGAGGLFVVVLAARFGRLPVLFWFLVLAFATAAWCAGAKTFKSFMAARILNGFFSTVAQGGGLMFINDMFFFHEKARKINIWAGFVILSPYLGPLFAAFITSTQNWSWAFWVYTIMTALALLGTIAYVPETYYNRRVRTDAGVPNGSRVATLVGLHQQRVKLLAPNTLGTAIMRPVQVLLKPVVFLTCVAYGTGFSPTVGINTTLSIFISAPPYNFRAKQIGYFYFTPIVAALLGDIVGHWLHDFIARWYIHKHTGHFEPEIRLRAIWISTPFMIAGLVLIGFSLQYGYHYMITALGWGLYVFGIMITTVAINAYNLDCYPEGSGEVAAWINFSRTLGGFIISYFQVDWAKAMGTRNSFGIQAGMLAFAFILILIIGKWGKIMRAKSGPLGFKTG